MKENMPLSDSDNFSGLPQPYSIPGKHRSEASAAYIMMFSGMYFPIPLIEVVMSIIYYNYWKRESPFHAFHCFQAMISQLPVTILNNGLLAWVIILIVRGVKGTSGAESDFSFFLSNFTDPKFLIFFWSVIGLNVIYIIFSLIAYKKASKGRFFYLPLFGRVSYNRFFGPHAVTFKDKRESKSSNLPPG